MKFDPFIFPFLKWAMNLPLQQIFVYGNLFFYQTIPDFKNPGKEAEWKHCFLLYQTLRKKLFENIIFSSIMDKFLHLALYQNDKIVD